MHACVSAKLIIPQPYNRFQALRMANLVSILVILSEVSIALISVTTAIYAIGLPFLRSRIEKSLLESRERKRKLKEELEKSLHNENFVNNVKSKLEEHEQKEKSLYEQRNFLSVGKAMIIPCVFFALSLLFACFFMYISTDEIQFVELFSVSVPIDLIYLLIPTIFILCGIYYPLRILSVVEKIVLTPEAMPELTIVDFPKAFLINEEKEVIMKLRNTGGDIARNITAFVYLPAGFKILESSGASRVSTKTRPGLHVATFNRDRLDVRVTVHLGEIRLRTSSEPGKHSVFITFREEELKYEEMTLEIETRERETPR